MTNVSVQWDTSNIITGLYMYPVRTELQSDGDPFHERLSKRIIQIIARNSFLYDWDRDDAVETQLCMSLQLCILLAEMNQYF